MTTETTTRSETCNQCKFWKATEANQGQCRRQPPQAISFRIGDDLKFETRFPVTASDDWCGEFAR